MSIQALACFDLFPTQPLVGTMPVHGAGITANPLGFSVGGSGTAAASCGVSPRDEDAFGEPGARRLGLVAAKTSAANGFAFVTLGGTSQLNPPNSAANNGKLFKHIIGFSFKDMSSVQAPNVIQPIVQALQVFSGNTTTNLYNLFGIATNGAFLCHSTTTGTVRELNREYYVEIELRWQTAANGTSTHAVQCLLYIDGQLIASPSLTALGSANAASWMTSINWGIPTASASDTQVRRYVMADFYRMSVAPSSTAPFDAVLGPQRVMLVKPKAVPNNTGWTARNADSVTDALVTQWGNPDAAAASPEDEGVIEIEMDWNLKPSTIVNGVRFFNRLQREGSINRTVRAEWYGSGDTLISGVNSVPTATSAYYGSAQLFGRTTADVPSLDYANIVNSKLRVKALIS